MFSRSRMLFSRALSLRNIVMEQPDMRLLYGITTRYRSSTPLNTIIMFVPQQEAWIVERMGKFHRILEPGLNLLWPIVDKIKYVQSLKEIAIDVPKQSAITSDNVTLSIDGVLYLRIVDAYLASYGVEDPEFAITQLAQTTMRSELGKIALDKVFRERESLNVSIVEVINKASEAWGIACLRYEIRDIKLPARVQEAMQMQVEAERRKRAAILESEGVRAADINVAEGKRTSRILASEAEKQEQINKAAGEAQGMLAVADARARGLKFIAKALSDQIPLGGRVCRACWIAVRQNIQRQPNIDPPSEIPQLHRGCICVWCQTSLFRRRCHRLLHGPERSEVADRIYPRQDSRHAASLTLAEQYVQAFNKLARTNNTLILPANAGDVSNLVAQAMSIYTTVSAHNTQLSQNQQDTYRPSEVQFEDPLVNINAISEKGATFAGTAVPREEDSLAEYFSDDEEREKALQAQKKEQAQKLERDS